MSSVKFSLMMVTTQLLPKEFMIEQLEETIAELKSAVLPSEKKQAEEKLVSMCMLYTMKVTLGDKPLTEVVEDFEKFESLTKMINPGNN